MKAKKIISLLLTVAMIVACGVTAFAAPSGYITSSTTVLNGIDTETLTTGAVLPDANELYADFDVKAMTDDEFAAEYGSVPSEWGAAEGTSAYKVTMSLNKLGTLNQSMKIVSGRPAYSGLKLVKAEAQIVYGEGVALATDYKADFSGVNSQFTSGLAQCANMETYYNFLYSDTGANTAYPNANGTYADATVENAITLVFFAVPGSKLTFNKVSVIVSNYTAGTPGAGGLYAVWHPAKITLGEGGSDDPITVTEADNGATVLEYADDYDGEKKLEGKYIVMRDAIAEAGTLTSASRVVVEYKDGDSLLNKKVEYGKTLFDFLKITGPGEVKNPKGIQFGIVYDNAQYKAEKFTFTIK